MVNTARIAMHFVVSAPDHHGLNNSSYKLAQTLASFGEKPAILGNKDYIYIFPPALRLILTFRRAIPYLLYNIISINQNLSSSRQCKSYGHAILVFWKTLLNINVSREYSKKYDHVIEKSNVLCIAIAKINTKADDVHIALQFRH